MAESSAGSGITPPDDFITVNDDGMIVVHGSALVDGNLEVVSQLTAKNLTILGDNNLPAMSTVGETISFTKACFFKGNVTFSSGKTIIGFDRTYNSPYVGSSLLQAGDRLVVGDSTFKITADERHIMADTYKMTLAQMIVDDATVKGLKCTTLLQANKVKVSGDLIGNNIEAQSIKAKKLSIDELSNISLKTSGTVQSKNLVVENSAKMLNDLVIMGTYVNGAALTVNGGEIVANKGIVSHTRNNRFQTMQIMGSGKAHDVCFRIDRDVDSLIEGNVTIHGSELILDESTLTASHIRVTGLNDITEKDIKSGLEITSNTNWEVYKDEAISEIPADEANTIDENYDPVQTVNEAMLRNQKNYESIQSTVKSLINPISYLMEQRDPSIPNRFIVSDNTIYRIDHSGNALLKNIISEKGEFSSLKAHTFNTNQLHVDKLVTTAVASNVLHSDQLLKSEGIAEFDGVVNSNADIFLEEESHVTVANGADVTFQNGSTLTLRSGSKFELGNDTSMKMQGEVELDLNKLILVDSTTGKKFKIMFRDAHENEGTGIVMTYEQIHKSDRTSTSEVANNTQNNARKLNEKLKSLGL